MNTSNQQPGDEQLGTLLRESRPAPERPARFQENVWRRIEQAEVEVRPASGVETLARLLLQPKFTMATMAVVLLTGTLLGSMNGQAEARLVAQERYVASVAMPIAP